MLSDLVEFCFGDTRLNEFRICATCSTFSLFIRFPSCFQLCIFVTEILHIRFIQLGERNLTLQIAHRQVITTFRLLHPEVNALDIAILIPHRTRCYVSDQSGHKLTLNAFAAALTLDQTVQVRLTQTVTVDCLIQCRVTFRVALI